MIYDSSFRLTFKVKRKLLAKLPVIIVHEHVRAYLATHPRGTINIDVLPLLG